MCEQHGLVCREIRFGHTCRLVLPPDVPFEAILCASPQFDGVSGYGDEEAVFSDGLRGMRPSNTYKPQPLKWQKAKHTSNKSIEKVIDKENAFGFKPYSYTPPGIARPQLFKEMNE